MGKLLFGALAITPGVLVAPVVFMAESAAVIGLVDNWHNWQISILKPEDWMQ